MMPFVGAAKRRVLSLLVLAAIGGFAGGCGGSTGSTGPTGTTGTTSTTPGGSTGSTSSSTAGTGTTTTSQAPVPASNNPPGDIPDSTVYVPYTSKTGGFTLTPPEGWARAQSATSLSWTSALNSVGIAWKPATSAPTTASATSVDVPALQKSSLAFTLVSIKAVSLPGGAAVEIIYQTNSKPDPVTGRQYRLVIERFAFFKNGREADLSLYAPSGADNVDAWRTVSHSFKWS